MIEAGKPLQFSILQDPPSLEAINRERERLIAAVQTHKVRQRIAAVAIALASSFSVAAAYLSWGLLDTVKLVVAPGVLVCVFVLLEISGSETDEEQAIRQLEPLSSGSWADLIEACQLNARADDYRMKVVAQGRNFVVAEGLRFSAWKNGQGSKEWVLAHTPRSIGPALTNSEGSEPAEVAGA